MVQSREYGYEIHSKLNPAQLLDALAAIAGTDPAFAVPRPAPDRLDWEFDSRYGGRWKFSLAANTKDPPDHDRMTGTLTPARQMRILAGSSVMRRDHETSGSRYVCPGDRHRPRG